MTSLNPQDLMRLRAAEGWLELGNHVEADAELAQIALPGRTHPDVHHWLTGHSSPKPQCAILHEGTPKLS